MLKKLTPLALILSMLGIGCAVDAVDAENTDTKQLATDNEGGGTDITTRAQCISGCQAALEYCIEHQQGSLPPGETCESKSRDCVDYCYDTFPATRSGGVVVKPPIPVIVRR